MRARTLIICLTAAALAAAGCILDSDPANRPPVIASLGAAPSATAGPGDTLTVSVRASDPEGRPLAYAWSATRGGFPDGADAAAVAWVAPAQAGPCTATVRIDDGRDAVAGALALVVTDPAASIAASPDTLDFGTGLDSLTITVANPGSIPLLWTALEAADWLDVAPNAGQVAPGASATAGVRADRAGLAPGTHRAGILLASNGGQDTVRVVLRVQGPASLAIETPQPSFGLIGGRLAVVIRNGGGGALGWTAAVTTGGSWAAALPAAGAVTTGTDTVWVTADRTGLAPGTHYCSLVITPDAGGPRTIPLRAYVAAEPARGVRVLATHPHDPGAFTQGLAWDRDALVEGTGHYGESELRRVDPATGGVLRSVALAANEFGEGVAVVRDRVLQLTWQNQRAFVRDLATFAPLDTLPYTGEGWGLAWDGARLVMSNGSSALVFRDPDTFAETGRVTVTTGGVELERLNELECAGGLVWANVWLTDFIARIDPASGTVVDWLDLTGLLTREQELAADALNGIAVDGESGRVFVTGKDWPSLFEVEVLDQSSAARFSGTTRGAPSAVNRPR